MTVMKEKVATRTAAHVKMKNMWGLAEKKKHTNTRVTCECSYLKAPE